MTDTIEEQDRLWDAVENTPAAWQQLAHFLRAQIRDQLEQNRRRAIRKELCALLNS